MRAFSGVLIALCVGCSGNIGGGGGDGPDAAAGAATVVFTAPAPGTTFTRDSVQTATGALVADVPVTVATTGPVARVAITHGSVALGDVDASGSLHAMLDTAGAATLTATAYDAAGAPVATATLDLTIVEPTAADCHAWLDLYKVQYTVGPVSPGVVDPVTVQGAIGGIPFRYLGNSAPRATFFMDCQLALSLAKAAPVFHAHDVKEVDDLGVYNYRCINNAGTPPNCTIGMSQHAYAMAIDLAQFTTTDATTYTVKTDFVINPAGDTCTATTTPGKDAWLHQIICELKGDKIWNIVLTPNYNDLHRDHFHVDLTPGADYIKLTGDAPPVDE